MTSLEFLMGYSGKDENGTILYREYEGATTYKPISIKKAAQILENDVIETEDFFEACGAPREKARPVVYSQWKKKHLSL